MAKRAKTVKADQKTAVAYIRVSTDEQQLGPDAQRAAILAYAAREGVAVVAWCSDLGVSGGASLERRPGLLAALAALEVHGAGVLLVSKRDRVARDVMIAAMVDAATNRVGARVVSVAGEGTDDEGPTGQLMRRMVDAFAEYERALIGARTAAALAVKSARGERVGSIPLGKMLNAEGKLVPNPAELEAMALVRDLRAQGWTWKAIGEALNARGLNARSGKAWHSQTLGRMAA